jgi:hypothetical protein
MGHIIPLLQDLVWSHPDYNLQELAGDFYSVHEKNGGWLTAQEHWERVVGRFLRASELRRLSGEAALKQAVLIAAAFLTSPGMIRACPICAKEKARENERQSPHIGSEDDSQ